MPRIKGKAACTKAGISKNISTEMSGKKKKKQKQAVAIAFSTCRRAKKRGKKAN